VVAALVLGSAAAEELPRGTVIERIRTRAEPQVSYALYLPTSLAPGRPAPVLYALDARGRAVHVIERFREAAERFSWILVSSHDSRSDGPVEPTLNALRAMWVDTHARLALDDRRAYLTGFSGGARMALLLAQAAPGTVAGVIAVGAGFAYGTPPETAPPFALYGIAGEADFNWSELQRLDAALRAASATHRVVDFEGRHEWPPTDVCTDAVAWMEVVGMKEERRPRDQSVADAVYARDLEAARRFEAAGRPLDAWRRYDAAARDLQGLRDVTEARAAADRLGASKPVQKARRDRERNLDRERDAFETARQGLAAATFDETALSLSPLLARMGITDLRRRAASDDGEERRHAQRVLETIASQTGFYLPRDLLDRGDAEKALLSLRVAHDLQPENASVWYMLARACARLGRTKDALSWLARVADTGRVDRARVEGEADFAPLRRLEGFGALLDRLSAAPAS
jgi:predicted esterase